MKRPNFSSVTRILSSGTWFEIEEGSLDTGAGVQHVNVGVVEPLYRFRFPDGQQGVILARCLDGWAPLVTEDHATRPEPMGEFKEPPRVTESDGREILNPFAHVRATHGDVPAGLNRPA